MSTLKNWQQQLSDAQASLSLVKRSLEADEFAMEEAKKKLSIRKEALAFFTKAANAAQEKVSDTLSAVVTMSLIAVFGDGYDFKVRFVTRRNSTEADLVLTKGGNEVDPIGNSGLGVANIIAIAMRAAFIVMENKYARFMVLDEPTAALMVSKQALAGEVLKTLCDKLKFQILVVTHSPDLAEYGDYVYHVDMDSHGTSEVRRLENKDDIRLIMEGQ